MTLEDKVGFIHSKLPAVLPVLAQVNEEYAAATGQYLEFHLNEEKHPDGSISAPAFIYLNHEGKRHEMAINAEAKANMALGIMPPAVPVEETP